MKDFMHEKQPLTGTFRGCIDNRELFQYYFSRTFFHQLLSYGNNLDMAARRRHHNDTR